jgi:pimeloyl-ACP methyl ester carboxylesterase
MKTRRWIRWFAIATLCAVVLWLVASLAVTWWLVHRRKARFDEPLPAELAGRAESFRLATRDGEELGAWFVDATRSQAPTVLLLHSKDRSRTARVANARVFESAGCAVLLITLRAHGDSTGERNDMGFSARLDVVAAVEWLEQRRPAAPIVVCGSSLGAAAGAFAAGELGERVDGYIFECMYPDLSRATRDRLRVFLPPVLDDIAYGGLRLWALVLLPDLDQIAPIQALERIPNDVPVLLLAGARDQRTTPDETREMFTRIRDHAQLVFVDDADHDQLIDRQPAAYAHAVLDFAGRVERERH